LSQISQQQQQLTVTSGTAAAAADVIVGSAAAAALFYKGGKVLLHAPDLLNPYNQAQAAPASRLSQQQILQAAQR
jgi:hypothetical protein